MTNTPPVDLEGMAHAIEQLENPTWAERPMRGFFDRWRLWTLHKTVSNFKRGHPLGWIDTGDTRQSMTSEATPDHGMPAEAVVGSNVMTARWGDMGTGIYSEDPDSSKRRYLPPAAALDPWADKHKIEKVDDMGISTGEFMTGADVAWSIFLAGGTKPRRYLRDAFEESQPHIPGWLTIAADEIETEAGK